MKDMETLTFENRLKPDLILIDNLLRTLDFIHTDETQFLFDKLAIEAFELEIRKITKVIAQDYLLLLNTVQHFFNIIEIHPSIENAFPEQVIRGFKNVKTKLFPMQKLFEGIASGTLSEND